jgi:serine-type D-Ala-D-Ala carboxypeptidase (penicillin-binding protein 5/6)
MRWLGGAALGGAAALGMLLTVASPADAAAPAGGRLPPPPACATHVAIATGRTTTKAVPLPAPTSDAGGARLAQPGLQVSLPSGAPRPPALRATAWIVADLATGNVLASCNAHVPLAPASTLKTLTAVALHPRIDQRTRYVARPEDAAVEGTKVGLVPGSVYSVDNLWHGLLMGSGNDAANALAALAGGMPAATELMTRTAHSLGAMDTVVANTSGLDAKGQVSSAYDLAIIGRALLRDPALATLVRTKTYAFPGGGTAQTRGARRTFQIQNHDLLLFTYPGATGIKNGYTVEASATFVGSATRGGHSYVVALLRTDFDAWRLAAALLDWAFANGSRAEPVGVLAPAGAPLNGTAPNGTAFHGAAAQSRPDAPASAAPGHGRVPAAVSGPVAATLRSVPQESRSTWLIAAFVVAVAGSAVVRVLTSGWRRADGRGRKPPAKASSRRP